MRVDSGKIFFVTERRKPMLGDTVQRKLSRRQNGEIFTFPIGDGTVNLSGRDQVFRKSTLIRGQPGRGEEQKTQKAKPYLELTTLVT